MISKRSIDLANEVAKVPGPGTYNPSAKDIHPNPSNKWIIKILIILLSLYLKNRIRIETRAGLYR